MGRAVPLPLAGSVLGPGPFAGPARKPKVAFLFGLVFRPHIRAVSPVTRGSPAILVRIQRAIHSSLIECPSADSTSIHIVRPLISGSCRYAYPWPATHWRGRRNCYRARLPQFERASRRENL